MFVTADVQITSATEIEAAFGIAFGIELYKLASVPRYIGHKGDKMLFCHWVTYCYKVFVLHFFYCNCMLFVSFFCFKWWQSYATTAYKAFAAGVDYIAAYGTHIEL